MGTTERREREKAELRQKILEAARDLFRAEGADSVTMRKLAERIEYSPTAIYAYFPDKEALLLALCEHDFTALLTQGAHLLQLADPIERIVRTAHFYVDFALRHPHQYEFMFMTAGLDLALPSDAGIVMYEAARAAVAEAMAQGRLHSQWSEPGPVLYALWAALHGIAALQIAGRYALMQKHPKLHQTSEDLSPQHIAQVAVEGLLHGFLKPV
jgi:AcrR family transcriptional regulator